MSQPQVRWENTPFAMIPRWIVRHPRLSSRAVHLFALLATYTDGHHDEAFPSRQTLAKILGCGTTAVGDAKRELVAAGALRVQERPGFSNLYLLQGSPPAVEGDTGVTGGVGMSTGGVSAERQGGCRHSDTEVEPLEEEPGKKISCSTPSNDPDLAVVFDAFWERVPKKAGKKKARAAFERVLKRGDATASDLTEGMERLASHMRETEQMRFVPHPTTWLNRGGWEEDPAEVYPEQTPRRNGTANNRQVLAEALGLDPDWAATA